MTTEFARHLEEDARLVILRELSAQVNNTLNESTVTDVLELWGHNRSREWVRTQIRKLGELGAVRVTDRGGFLICELTQAGMDHVLRRSVIDGVKRPTLR
jgi:hypothetical protein